MHSKTAFLVGLGDTLRPLRNPIEIISITTRTLGEHLNVSRVVYSTLDETGTTAATEGDWTDGTVASLPDRVQVADFGAPLIAALESGDPLVVADVAHHPATAESLPALRGIDVAALVSVPLVKEGRLVANLNVHSKHPRLWAADEVSLVEAVAERTWDVLARAEAIKELEDREHELRVLTDALPVLISYVDKDERYRFHNAAYRKWFGGEDGGLDGKLVREVIGDTAYAQLKPQIERALSGERFNLEQFVPYEGGARHVHVDFIPRVSRNNTTDGYYALIQDISDRVAAESKLRESEAKLQFLDRLGAETAHLSDADAVLATTTRLLGEHLKLSVCAYADMDDDQNGFTIRGDWAAPGSTSIVGHYQLADFGKLAVQNLSAGLPLVVNDNVLELAPEEAATFQNIGIAATICMPLVKDGRLTALMAIHDRVPRNWTDAELSLLREVTERSWAHVERVATVAALEESEERLRLAVDNAEIGFWDVDLIQNKLIWPPRTKALFGISPEVPVTMNDFYSGLHPDDRDGVTAAFARAADPDRRELYDVEYRTIGKEDGAVRWVAAKGKGIFDNSGRCVRVTGTAVDISSRVAAQVALRESEAGLRELNETLERRVATALAERKIIADVIDGTDILVQVVDPNFNWLAINAAAASEFSRIFEVPRPKAGDNMLKVLDHRPDVRASLEALWARALSGEEFVEILAIGAAAPEQRHYEMRFRALRDEKGQLAGAYQFVADVTERLSEQARLKEAEETLRQSQKMEAMGQLTGGVAHDFNNLLTAVISNLELLAKQTAGDPKSKRLIEGAMQGAQRGATLTQRMLAFARRQELTVRQHNLAFLVRRATELLERSVGDQIVLEMDISRPVPMALVDDNQFDLALLNLVINARDAMPHGGTIRISVDLREDADDPPTSRQGYVCLTVEDEGEGMDEDTLEKAVQPFFSTKGVGKGSGLGLSMIHGLASQLNGKLILTSNVGQGTKAELWIPATGDGDSEVVAPKPESTPRRSDRSLRILFVDDDALISMSSVDMLEDLGHAVTPAYSGAQALELLRSGPEFDLLITDFSMPKMTGGELAVAVRALYPNLPILLATGYAELPSGHDLRLPRLAKPYLQCDLDAEIRNLFSQA